MKHDNDNDAMMAQTTEQRRLMENAMNMLMRDHNAAKIDEQMREAAKAVFGEKRDA